MNISNESVTHARGFMPQKMNVLLFHRIALNQSDLPFLPYKNERNGEKPTTKFCENCGASMEVVDDEYV